MNAMHRPIWFRTASIAAFATLALMSGRGGPGVRAATTAPGTDAASGSPAPAAPAAASPAPPRCDAPEYRQFDFWAGEWDVTSAANGSAAGTNSVTRTLDGCVLQE